MTRAVLCTPLRVEQLALRRAAYTMPMIHTGMGPGRAAATAATLPPTAPVIVAGVAAAQAPHIRPGDVVVATEVSGTGLPGSVEIRSAVLLAGALRGLGLRVHLGAVRSVGGIAWRAVPDGTLAVDMESAQLAPADAPFAVVRAIVDTLDHPLWHVGTLWRGVRALRALAACRPALEWWATATGPRQVLLIGPGSGCDGLARQVDLVLAVGSPDSPAIRCDGVPTYRVDDVSGIDLRWLAGRVRLGLAAPSHLVPEIVHCLSGLGALTTTEAPASREVS